jgi:hypothetical protein
VVIRINSYGQLGLGDNTSNPNTPCKIEGVPQIVQVSSGYQHNLILDSHGGVLSSQRLFDVGCFLEFWKIHFWFTFSFENKGG